ncbi:hypothetical protein C8Q74DRAFT_1225494 [Fomes fomentarius]|nr:hypothetical protein C8Q74DRAFT_1225494 [Fomes fomentarius]
MASAASTSSSSRARPSRSASTTSTIFVTVHVTASPTFITTTFTSSGAESVPTVATGAVIQSNVPVAAIASGTAAGVVLALAAVIGWTWWGRCIKRKEAKRRKEALAYLEVRENTRRNASTLSQTATQHKPTFSMRGPHGRKVTFVPNGPASSQSTLRGTVNLEKGVADAEKSMRPPPPRPPTPTAHLHNLKKPEAVLPPPVPPVPRRHPQRERRLASSLEESSSYTQHRLMHQASTLSSGSVYSTQSAIEESQTGAAVPSSLIMALTNEGSRRSLLATYLPWNRYRTSVASNNRLSEYSTGSVYSQLDDQAWESVGFAYGGEDELPRQ